MGNIKSAKLRRKSTESSSSSRRHGERRKSTESNSSSVGHGERLAFDEIKEEKINNEGREEGQRNVYKDVLCDLCLVMKSISVAMVLCFTCEKYVCSKCFRSHVNHFFVSVKSEESGRVRARERMIDEMMRERRREEELEREKVSICDRMSVKHELDTNQRCFVTGLCGLDYGRLVACDYNNSCIKIFQLGSNILQRYIRIGSEPQTRMRSEHHGPYSVTEIKVKQNSTVPDSASSSSSDSSVTNRKESDKQGLLAVTLPRKRHILFIDVNKSPAIKVKSFSVEKECYGIDFIDDKIFTVCKEEDNSLYDLDPFSVYVMSTDGIKLSVIQTGIRHLWLSGPDLAVVHGRVYITDMLNNKVKCFNVDGRVISQITMEEEPSVISIDPDQNVYVGTELSNIHKLGLDLSGPPRPLLDQTTGYVGRPWALCFYKDKLFVSHWPESSVEYIVSVIRLV